MAQKVYSYAVKTDHRKKRKSKRKNVMIEAIQKAFLTLMAIIVVSGVFLLYNLQYSKVNSNLVAVRKLKNQVDSLQNINDKLSIHYKRLTHVTRVHRYAEKKLGLSSRGARPVMFYIDKKKLEKAEKMDEGLNEAIRQ